MEELVVGAPEAGSYLRKASHVSGSVDRRSEGIRHEGHALAPVVWCHRYAIPHYYHVLRVKCLPEVLEDSHEAMADCGELWAARYEGGHEESQRKRVHAAQVRHVEFLCVKKLLEENDGFAKVGVALAERDHEGGAAEAVVDIVQRVEFYVLLHFCVKFIYRFYDRNPGGGYRLARGHEGHMRQGLGELADTVLKALPSPDAQSAYCEVEVAALVGEACGHGAVHHRTDGLIYPPDIVGEDTVESFAGQRLDLSLDPLADRKCGGVEETASRELVTDLRVEFVHELHQWNLLLDVVDRGRFPAVSQPLTGLLLPPHIRTAACLAAFTRLPAVVVCKAGGDAFALDASVLLQRRRRHFWLICCLLLLADQTRDDPSDLFSLPLLRPADPPLAHPSSGSVIICPGSRREQSGSLLFQTLVLVLGLLGIYADTAVDHESSGGGLSLWKDFFLGTATSGVSTPFGLGSGLGLDLLFRLRHRRGTAADCIAGGTGVLQRGTLHGIKYGTVVEVGGSSTVLSWSKTPSTHSKSNILLVLGLNNALNNQIQLGK